MYKGVVVKKQELLIIFIYLQRRDTQQVACQYDKEAKRKTRQPSFICYSRSCYDFCFYDHRVPTYVVTTEYKQACLAILAALQEWRLFLQEQLTLKTISMVLAKAFSRNLGSCDGSAWSGWVIGLVIGEVLTKDTFYHSTRRLHTRCLSDHGRFLITPFSRWTRT